MLDNKPFIVSEIELTYKNPLKSKDRPVIQSSKDCHTVLLSIWSTDLIGFLEQFKILLLNKANHVLAYYEVSKGGICGTVADPRVIFAAALKSCATSIVLAHNHPSGNLQPSQADMELTKKLRAAGKLLDIEVLDHIILTEDTYFSFADEGLF